MLGLITSKIGMSIVGLILLSGAGFYVKFLIEKQVLMQRDIEDREQALDTLAVEYSQYALNSEALIEAYNANNEVLQEEYQKSRDIVSESIKRSNKHDYQKILNANPGAFIKRANAATKRLFDDLEKNSTYPQGQTDTGTSETPLPR